MKQTILLMLFVILFAGGISYSLYLNATTCDEHVTLTDGTEYDCREVDSYVSGMSVIRLCGDKTITVPTVRIKDVVEIQSTENE